MTLMKTKKKMMMRLAKMTKMRSSWLVDATVVSTICFADIGVVVVLDYVVSMLILEIRVVCLA